MMAFEKGIEKIKYPILEMENSGGEKENMNQSPCMWLNECVTSKPREFDQRNF